MKHSAAWVLGLLVAAITAGCNGPPVGQVAGVVRFEGTPITEGTVVFSNAAAGVHLTAKVETDGSYVVETHEANGLPYGEYVVTVLPPPADLVTGQPTPPIQEFPNIPAKYRDQAESGLKLTVGPGKNSFDVNMVAE